jgi:hypothetical protein
MPISESLRAAVWNVRSVYVILVKQNIIELPHVHDFAALLARIEVPFLRFL